MSWSLNISYDLTQAHQDICCCHVQDVHVGGGPHVGLAQNSYHHQQVTHHPHQEDQQVSHDVHQLHRESEDVGLLNPFA